MSKELIYVLISFVLYYTAPSFYDWFFCILCFLVFLVASITTLWPDLKKGHILSFNVVFLFSYFWTSFAYPIIIYGTDIDRGHIINKIINWDNLCHTCALALVFITIYIYGFSRVKPYSNISQQTTINKYFKSPNILFILISIPFIFVAILSFIKTGKNNMNMGMFLIDIYFAVQIINLYINIHNQKSFVVHSFKNFVRINKIVIFVSIIVFLLFIIIGDRGPAIKTILIIFSAYYLFWDRISVRKLCYLGVFFLLLLFFVRQTRGREDNFATGTINAETVKEVFSMEEGMLYVFADLFYINRELCLGYEYNQNNPLFYPERIIYLPLYPFPLLPSLISNIISGVDISSMDTGMELNRVAGYEGFETNFGNHPAGDLYMSFGFWGLVLLMFLFGGIIGKIEKYKNNNIYFSCCYLTLMGFSLYLARTSIFSIVRPLGYIFIIIYILYKIPFKTFYK